MPDRISGALEFASTAPGRGRSLSLRNGGKDKAYLGGARAVGEVKRRPRKKNGGSDSASPSARTGDKSDPAGAVGEREEEVDLLSEQPIDDEERD